MPAASSFTRFCLFRFYECLNVCLTSYKVIDRFEVNDSFFSKLFIYVFQY